MGKREIEKEKGNNDQFTPKEVIPQRTEAKNVFMEDELVIPRMKDKIFAMQISDITSHQVSTIKT